jgi:hypothetical protein
MTKERKTVEEWMPIGSIWMDKYDRELFMVTHYEEVRGPTEIYPVVFVKARSLEDDCYNFNLWSFSLTALVHEEWHECYERIA